jgi:hypothetical protein
MSDQGSRAVMPRAAASPAALEYDNGMTETKRSRMTVVAVVALALLLGVSLFALLGRGDNGGPTAKPPGSAPSTPAGGSTAPEVPEPLTATPEGVTWQLFQGVALPVSRVDGPTRVNGPVAAGYSRTPTGALLAASQIRVRALATPGVENLLRVVDEQFAPGPGKAAYRNLISNVTDTAPPAGGYTQYVGFRYLSYSPEVAVISLASRGNSGVLRASTNTVRWLDGDWRLEKPADAQEPSQVLQDRSGYVPWAGVS